VDAVAHPEAGDRGGARALTAIEYAGWLGNACFFGRFAIQWISVERQHTRAAPRLFWVLSIAGSLLLGAFALQRGTWILLVGFTINSIIYARNLRLGSAEEGLRITGWGAAGLACGAALALMAAGIAHAHPTTGEAWGWIGVAMIGQAMWSSRFVVQWLLSERTGQSHFPPAFWVFSLAGNVLLLLYAIHLREPVFIAGLALGPFVQLRNLWLTGLPGSRASLPEAKP
jgi:lipid-A-disaccharide synthase-like uncharacterized protein